MNLEQRVATMTQRLKENPALFAQVENLLREVHDEVGQVRTLDETEDAVVARLRSLGQEALQTWLQQAAVQTPVPTGARRAAKKKSRR